MYTVYKHTTPSGKVYIGITKNKPEYRWKNGNGYKDNAHFDNAIKKYGWENIEHEIVQNGLSKQQACDLEIELIAKYGATDPRNGYNNSTGGECGGLGVHHSAESRLKCSEALKGRHVSVETRRKLSESLKGANHPNYGKHLSAETRRKIGEAQKGANNHCYGKHLSAETRRKMSESHKGKTNGKPLSVETRRKISEAKKGANNPWYGKHHSAETRHKMSEANGKAVICVETGTLYSSGMEAAKSIGVSNKAISNVLRGINKTSGGYHWKYAD